MGNSYTLRKRRKKDNRISFNRKDITMIIGVVIMILSITLISMMPRTYYEVETVDVSDRIKAVGEFDNILLSRDGERAILATIENSNEIYLLFSGSNEVNFRSDSLADFKLIATINETTMAPCIYSIEGNKDTTIVFYNITVSFLFKSQTSIELVYGISKDADILSLVIVGALLVFLMSLFITYDFINTEIETYKYDVDEYKDRYLDVLRTNEYIRRDNETLKDACKTCTYFRMSEDSGNNYPDKTSDCDLSGK